MNGDGEPHALLCPQCSAPLPGMDAAGMMHCHYCNAVIEAPQAAEMHRAYEEKRLQSEKDREREARHQEKLKADAAAKKRHGTAKLIGGIVIAVLVAAGAFVCMAASTMNNTPVAKPAPVAAPSHPSPTRR